MLRCHSLGKNVTETGTACARTCSVTQPTRWSKRTRLPYPRPCQDSMIRYKQYVFSYFRYWFGTAEKRYALWNEQILLQFYFLPLLISETGEICIHFPHWFRMWAMNFWTKSTVTKLKSWVHYSAFSKARWFTLGAIRKTGANLIHHSVDTFDLANPLSLE
jgi:hypothetical protein